MHITFVGTPFFSKRILENLINSGINISSVVTGVDKKSGRGKVLNKSNVKIFAEERKIPVFYKIEDLIQTTDLFIVAGYGRIIPNSLLSVPKYKFINFHPSLLPIHRGPSPIQKTILNNDKKTGITIILMDKQVDHGPVLVQKEIFIDNLPNIYYQQLEEKLIDLGSPILSETIKKWIEGKIEPIPQDDKSATFSKIIKKEDGKIDWNKEASIIYREVRAFHIWPSSYTFLNKKLVKIKKAEIVIGKTDSPGKIIENNNTILVSTGDNFLKIKELQIEGKKTLTSKEFLQGNKIDGSMFV